MMTSSRTLALIGAGALVAAVAAPTPAEAKKKKKGKKKGKAAEPCGGIVLGKGSVSTGRAMPARTDLNADGKVCVESVAKALGDNPAIRTVTVSVKLPDSQRIGGKALKIGEMYKKAIAKAGVRKSRISTVAPPAEHGEEGTVSIAFTEKKSRRPVAVIESASGDVKAGKRKKKLSAAKRGQTFTPNTYVVTGAGSSALVGLADGSRIRMGPGAEVKIGSLHLNDDLKRVVKLTLTKGDVEADVRKGGDGSVFDIETRTGVAGVRGTEFRVSFNEAGEMKLETLEGAVELTPEDGGEAVTVEAGQGVAMDAAGKPKPRKSLLGAPKAEKGLKGPVTAEDALTWTAVEGATAYQIELARDAEFSYGLRALDHKEVAWPPKGQLTQGKWFWRVSAVDDDGFVGKPSKTYSFELAKADAAKPRPPAAPAPEAPAPEGDE